RIAGRTRVSAATMAVLRSPGPRERSSDRVMSRICGEENRDEPCMATAPDRARVPAHRLPATRSGHTPATAAAGDSEPAGGTPRRRVGDVYRTTGGGGIG